MRMGFTTKEERTIIITCKSECDRCGTVQSEVFESTEKKRSSSALKDWSTFNLTIHLGTGGAASLSLYICPMCTAMQCNFIKDWHDKLGEKGVEQELIKRIAKLQD